MKEMETFIKAFGEGLRTLAQGVQAIADKLDSFVGTPGGDRDFDSEPVVEDNIPSEAAEEKPDMADFQQKPAVNATAVVHEAIITATEPVTLDQLAEKTGFDRKKLNNILYRLRKAEKIKNVEKGVYTKN